MDRVFSRRRTWALGYQQVSVGEAESEGDISLSQVTRATSSADNEDIGTQKHTSFASSTDVRSPDSETKANMNMSTLSQASKHQKFKERNIFRLWWVEAAGVCAALTTFFAICVLVYPYRQEPTAAPSWSHIIGINTVISILSVIVRVGLLAALTEALGQQKWIWFKKDRQLIDLVTFDRATRGEWGSILLLFRLSYWSPIAYLGALAIILTVAIGPFVQQVIRFTNCSLLSSSKIASLPRHSIINDFSPELPYLSLPLSLQSAIIAAGLTPEANLISANCISGSCLFRESFSTLGYCSSCQDISNQLKTSSQSHITVTGGSLNVTNFLLPSSYLSLNSKIFDQTSSLNGPYLVTSPTYERAQTFQIIYKDSYSTKFDTQSYASFMGALLNSTYQIISRADSIDCTDTEKKDPALSWKCRGYGAAECSIYPCIQTLNANMINGTLQEERQSSISSWGLNSTYSDKHGWNGYYPIINSTCLTSEQRQGLDISMYNISLYDEWLPWNTSFDPYSNNSSVSDAECIYQIGFKVVLAIGLALDSLLANGTTTSKDFASVLYQATQEAHSRPGVQSPIIIPSWTQSSVPDIMYNNGDTSFSLVENLFANISKAITANLRQNYYDSPLLYSNRSIAENKNLSQVAPASTKPVQGIVIENGTCVQARWWWLAYPAVVILLTIVFVVRIMISILSIPSKPGEKTINTNDRESAQDLYSRSISGWKSSLLPFMFHGLEDRKLRNRDYPRLISEKEMEHEAKIMKVKLARTDDGWKLTESYD